MLFIDIQTKNLGIFSTKILPPISKSIQTRLFSTSLLGLLLPFSSSIWQFKIKSQDRRSIDRIPNQNGKNISHWKDTCGGQRIQCRKTGLRFLYPRFFPPKFEEKNSSGDQKVAVTKKMKAKFWMEEAEIVLSGDFSVPRNDISALVSRSGGKISTVLTKKVPKQKVKAAYPQTTALCVGNNAKTSKKQEAALLGIPIVDEKFVWEYIKVKASQGNQVSIHGKRPRNEKYSSPMVERYLIQEHEDKRIKRRKEEQKRVSRVTKKSKMNGPVIAKDLVFKVIALEGEIGAGKSTLSSILRLQFPDHCSVYEEQTNEGFLKLFYSNPVPHSKYHFSLQQVKYGFAFQWGMLKTRLYQLQLAQREVNSSRNISEGYILLARFLRRVRFYMWDRSMIGDYIFAFWNFLQGSISKEEMAVYESEFGGSLKNMKQLPFLKDIHCFTFLNDEPEACKFRVEKLRKNESEQGIPLPYYQGIDDIHFSLTTNVSKILVLNWGDYDDAHSVVNALARVLSAHHSNPKVEYRDRVREESLPQKTKLYKDSEDIVEAYRQIKEGNIKMDETIRQIWIPRNVLTVQWEEKKVIREHAQSYGIIFYRNEYKRVVFWHLSQFHSIVFYNLLDSFQ